MNKDTSILIDPGAKHHVKTLLEKLKPLCAIKDLDYIVCQSNDYLNITAIEELIHEGFKGTLIINETGPAYLKDMYNLSIQTIESLDFKLAIKNQTHLVFHPTPFLPFGECFATYFEEAKALFTGHLFSYTDPSYSTSAINRFHEQVMPSVELIRHSLKTIKSIPSDTIYPRLGKPFKGTAIKQTIQSVAKHDFYNTQQVVRKINEKNRAYNYPIICNHMLKRLNTIFKAEEIVKVFKDTNINIQTFPSLEIKDTELTGYKLWNGFFEILYHKKGNEWLAVLEPTVKKYNKMYNINMPTIYKTKFVEQTQEITTLEEKLKTVHKKLSETTESLIRCPITDLYNERFFRQYLTDVINKPLNDGDVRGLITLHIDNLLAINKKHGPEKGNETLKNLVYTLKKIVHEDTLLFKQNGPGIFIYKHAIDPTFLKAVSAKIRNAIQDADVFIEPITVSLSIVTLDEIEETTRNDERVELFIARSLHRLEQAKKKGINQVLDKETEETYVEGAILLIDEDETNQNLMHRIFKRIQYDVVVARDIYDAEDLVRTQKFDVIISEINLSKLDGFQLKHTLNQQPLYSTIPFIIMSHHKNLEAINRANALGVHLVLQKPIIAEELIGHVIRLRDKRVME